MITIDVRDKQTTWVHHQSGAFPFPCEQEAYAFVARLVTANPKLSWKVIA